ncbi:MAG: Asp-tRNA(Asn)/Glu-tRNA(Gln) amidotransferase subunit GatB [Candidatus Wildermuthbacteria bacterium]|nr:Asp-tRNA(Asn)/Glu-tRNA(Gln) amidotransferase subunit GatB [Candidatus Wildermuthbacteria bacterium]
MRYIPTIGLEIHAELKTESKMFCSCKNDPNEKQPNVNICPICMGHPGTLPVPNELAIHMVIKTGLALQCTIAPYSKFDRKNYFYPDLPKGYQISQYDLPLCQKGKLRIEERDIQITRIHLEEDTGRSQHAENKSHSLVDFNRAGVPLMELVTEPDLHSGEESVAFAQELQRLLRYLSVSDADMEKGQMRVEANISIRPEGTETLGTKVEVKNLNSFRSVQNAIDFEIKRQTQVLNAGEEINQETRGWNETEKETFSQREKESAHDYRYFPEPDIPPLTFTPAFIEMRRLEIPELPQAKKLRLQKEYNLGEKEAALLVKDRGLGEYFEQVVSELGSRLSVEELAKRVKLVGNYIVSDLQGLLAGNSVEDKNFKITPENFAELVNMIATNKISSPAAKSLLRKMFATGGDPSQLLESEGLTQVSNQEEIARIAKEIIEKNPKAVQDYKNGKANAFQFLVGEMMAKTKGTANPETVRTNILKIIEG